MKFLLAAINAKYIHSNPGICSLKTYAESQRGTEDQCLSVQIEIAEYTINHQMERILEDIYRRKPDMIGFSCYIWNMNDALNLVHDLHKVLPDTDIWMGGPEVTFDAPELLAREPEITGVMKGEGEETFTALLRAYEKLGSSLRGAGRASVQGFLSELSKIPGVTYRDTDACVHDQPVRPVLNMNKIPFLYPTLRGFENRIVYYESSRGCPFSCSYCLSSADKSVRFRDTELVKQELQFFLDRNVPQVKFVDRTFNCRKSHAMAIWQYLLEHDNGVTNFHFEIAADLLDDDEIQLMRRMRPGLIQLEIGVQSTNPETIREIRRSMDLDKVKAVVAQVQAGHNIHQHLDLIVGLPYEDYDTFRRSFNEVYAMRPDQLQMGFLKVLKGSYMHECTKQYDLVYRELPPYEVLSTRWLPYRDVLRLKGIEDALEVHYNSGQFANTLWILEDEFPDAFGMFEQLAEYYDRRGLQERSHSRTARYEILHDFIGELLQGQDRRKTAVHNICEYEDALITDLYLRENCKSRPCFAPDQAPFKNRVKALVPDLRQLGSAVHAEVLQSGAVLLFDYREKDPLTKNAGMTRLDKDENHGEQLHCPRSGNNGTEPKNRADH